jgi:RHS repeat-associated protein
MKFTGHERDLADPTSPADDLDYMHARSTNPITGRFLSVDPLAHAKESQRRPQLWNRYAYALNNPLLLVDWNGKCPQCEAIELGEQAIEAAPEILKEAEVSIQEAEGLAEKFLLPALQRGLELHKELGARLGNALANNFRTIDRFVRATGEAISTKTIDLAAKTYQNAGALYSRLSGYLQKLVDFSGGGSGVGAIEPGQVQSKTLEIVIKASDLTVGQAEAIARLAQEAQAHGVTIRVVAVQ